MLRSDHAPLVASFLNRTFILAHVRFMSRADLAKRLEDQLFDLREHQESGAFSKSALEICDMASIVQLFQSLQFPKDFG